MHGARARLLVCAVGHVEDPAKDAGSDGEWEFTGAEHVGHFGRFGGGLGLGGCDLGGVGSSCVGLSGFGSSGLNCWFEWRA